MFGVRGWKSEEMNGIELELKCIVSGMVGMWLCEGRSWENNLCW